jgi:hypothetical protein
LALLSSPQSFPFDRTHRFFGSTLHSYGAPGFTAPIRPPVTMQSSFASRPSILLTGLRSANLSCGARPSSAAVVRCQVEEAVKSVGWAPPGPDTGRDPDAKKPAWLRQRAAQGEKYTELRESLGELKLNTVCVEAQCPNIGEVGPNQKKLQREMIPRRVYVLEITMRRSCEFWFDFCLC